MLEYLYVGTVRIDVDVAASLLELADYYGLEPLLKQCEVVLAVRDHDYGQRGHILGLYAYNCCN